MDIALSPIGELLPDQPDRDNPGVTVAENVIPQLRSYQPVRALVSLSTPIDSRCKGAAPLASDTGTTYNYAGDDNKLYVGSAGSYTDNGLAYTLDAKDFWEFESFQNQAFAVAGHSTPIQVASFGSTFADIVPTTGTVPNPEHVAVVRDAFLMVGNLATDHKAVQWCGANNPTIWQPTDQLSGLQKLENGGAVTRILGGEYAVIFKEHSIYRGTFIEDPDLVFQFDEVTPGRGTLSPGSVVQFGYIAWFLDIDGFYVWNGSGVEPIGSQKFNRKFLELYDNQYPESISGAVDVNNSIVFWAFPSKSAVNGVPDMMVAYNWVTKRFTGPIYINVEQLVYTRTPGVFSDNDTDPDYTSILSDDMDELSDSQIFKGGRSSSIGAFNNLHELSEFSGEPLEARIESGEYSFNTGGYAMLNGARSVVDGNSPNVFMQFGSRDTTSGPVNWSATIPISKWGTHDIRLNNRYHRLRLIASGDYSDILGAEPNIDARGRK